MFIYHYTDLKSALIIIDTKMFKAKSSSLYDGDSGLNSFPTLKGNFHYGQNFNKRGVILVFDWSGKIEENVSINMFRNTMNINTMYIQGGWRSFIPVNSDSKYLKAVNIIIVDENIIEELIEYPFYYHFIPNYFQNLKSKIYEKSRIEVDNQFSDLFRNKDIYINII